MFHRRTFDFLYKKISYNLFVNSSRRTISRERIRFDSDELYGILEVARRVNLKGTFFTESIQLPDVLEIWYLEKGKQDYEIENTSYSLKGGDVLLIYPNERQGFMSKTMIDRSILYWVRLKLPKSKNSFLGLPMKETQRLLDSIEVSEVRHFHGGQKIKMILDKWLDLATTDNEWKGLLMRNLALELLIRCLGQSKSQKAYGSQQFREIESYIDQNINEGIPIHKIMKKFRCSSSSLNHLFMKESGLTPHDYILRKKIKKSQVLLNQTSDTITKIAHQLSFSSSQYFCTAFKRVVGKTPSAFRLGK